jgi:NADH:ubiquinone oxidoreductase subunit 5 (subunit L)/multisubunit Na+/H+ antiporter MnhA subunit
MLYLIPILVLLPFCGLAASFLFKEKNEKWLANAAIYTAWGELLLSTMLLGFWATTGFEHVSYPAIPLYASDTYVFLVALLLDETTFTFLVVGSFLMLLISTYSKYYLHRENGYKRFYNTIILFFAGYVLTIFSGNFETLFIGWEMLGISSFLLIAFFRERYLPVRNAVKIFSVYRIGDVGILMAMWGSHHLWHSNILFIELEDSSLVTEHLGLKYAVGLFISAMIVLAASVKSAQLPFSSWLPRAMEGPTTSSAIFYGSLSVHLGVFLLLRTMNFWEHQTVIRIFIGLMGLSTSLVATSIARVQNNAKTQIAYSSIAQIGLIFIELALGLNYLALLHFAGNAFLRTYQLLISPSLVAYRIRDQFYNYKPHKISVEDSLPKRIEMSVYLLALREFNLDAFINRLIFRPFKKAGGYLGFLNLKNVLFFFGGTYLAGLALYFNQQYIPGFIRGWLPEIFALMGLLLVLRSFTERTLPRLSWLLIAMNHGWVALAVAFNATVTWQELAYYLSGIFLATVAGYATLHYLRNREYPLFGLNTYYGHGYEYPNVSFVFFLLCLAMMGFPITPSFIGEDLVLSHIESSQILLAVLAALGFVFTGISVIRIYARLFMGPHIKGYHPTPLKNS